MYPKHHNEQQTVCHKCPKKVAMARGSKGLARNSRSDSEPRPVGGGAPLSAARQWTVCRRVNELLHLATFHLTYPPLPVVSDEGRATSARRIGRLLHPSWSNARISIVLKGYLDASGTDPNQKVVAVAGWAATEKEWDGWELDWLKFLDEAEIKKGWHHTDFLSWPGRNEYKNWNDPKFLWADGELRRIFRKIKLFRRRCCRVARRICRALEDG